MSSSSHATADLSGAAGKALYDTWKRAQPHGQQTMHCPLTSLRTSRSGAAGEGAEFALPLQFKIMCLQLTKDFPDKHDIAPWTSEASIREFDCRCWWLGVSPTQGLTLRAHNWRENALLWP